MYFRSTVTFTCTDHTIIYCTSCLCNQRKNLLWPNFYVRTPSPWHCPCKAVLQFSAWIFRTEWHSFSTQRSQINVKGKFLHFTAPANQCISIHHRLLIERFEWNLSFNGLEQVNYIFSLLPLKMNIMSEDLQRLRKFSFNFMMRFSLYVWRFV